MPCALKNDIKLHKNSIKFGIVYINWWAYMICVIFWTCTLIYHSKVLKGVKTMWNYKQCKYHLDCGLLGVAKNRQGILCYYFQTFVRVYLAKTLVCTICYQYNPNCHFPPPSHVGSIAQVAESSNEWPQFGTDEVYGQIPPHRHHLLASSSASSLSWSSWFYFRMPISQFYWS